jgi:hypothetical protein
MNGEPFLRFPSVKRPDFSFQVRSNFLPGVQPFVTGRFRGALFSVSLVGHL